MFSWLFLSCTYSRKDQQLMISILSLPAGIHQTSHWSISSSCTPLEGPMAPAKVYLFDFSWRTLLMRTLPWVQFDPPDSFFSVTFTLWHTLLFLFPATPFYKSYVSSLTCSKPQVFTTYNSLNFDECAQGWDHDQSKEIEYVHYPRIACWSPGWFLPGY